MTVTASEVRTKGEAAKATARRMAALPTDVKNQALHAIADALIANEKEILAANQADYDEGKRNGLSDEMLERMTLNPARVAGIADDTRNVAKLPDPVGEKFDLTIRPNGLVIGKVRVPIGVVGAIFESRPNVVIDIASLCLKSGNAVLLRGGEECARSNALLGRIASEAATKAGVPEGAMQLVESLDRALVREMLKMNDVIDLLIPRGGPGLVNMVRENATMPVVSAAAGVCHTYVDKAADLDMAVNVVHNAKTRRPTICNALETLLVHRDVAETFLPRIAEKWSEKGVEMRCDPTALSILQKANGARGWKIVPASPEDFGKEFLTFIAAVRVVGDVDEAMEHIAKYGSGHSEAIITEDWPTASRFLSEVDAAAVYHNVSTQFTDGAQFGLGAEIGISTQKMHARGPMALKELTTYKWIILGNGQTRPL
ncbi:MAG: glutamate-5-semialdehyde dehydrogenase [Dehalococcoidia bacterium]|nr:glutamate-5-semialdehyde dehydrogenase [Dehalococcoidia bacterium]